MANIFNLILLYNFSLFLAVSSFIIDDGIADFFLNSPYKLTFGDNSKSEEIGSEFILNDIKEDLKEDELVEEFKLPKRLNEFDDLNDIKVGGANVQDEKVNEENNNVPINAKIKGENVEVDANEDKNAGVENKDLEVADDEDEIKEDNDVLRENLPSTFLLPGLGGSTLIVEYRNAYIPSCGKHKLNSKPFRLWLSVSRLISLKSNIYCTFDTIKLTFDKNKNKYYNPNGVIVTLEKQGHVKGVNYLDYFHNNGIKATGYYNSVSTYFLNHGYEDAHSLIGFPYDWRLPLHQQNYELLQKHIEYIYEKRNKTKVNLIGHSMGGLYINFFLTFVVNKKWKQKHINAIFYINSPFKGSIKALRALLYGDGNAITFNFGNMAKLSISQGIMKGLGRSLGSMYDLLPYAQYYDHNQIVILMNLDKAPIPTDKIKNLIDSCGLYDVDCYANRSDFNIKVYTLSNWFELLDPEIRLRVEKNALYIDRKYSIDHGVPIYCLYSTTEKKTTAQLLFFQSTNLNEDPYVYYGNGDETVPLESLEACKNFYNVKEVKWFNANHCGILHEREVVKYLYNVAKDNVN